MAHYKDGEDRQTDNRRVMLVVGVIIVGLLVCGAIFVRFVNSRTDEEPQQSQEREKSTKNAEAKRTPASVISFEVLRRWSPARGVGREILVSERATRQEVLSLASHLRKKYGSRGFIIIHIFDSKTAYEHRDDQAYPQDDYLRHFLATVMRNPNTGLDEIEWQAKGRDH